ncbi:MAG TPA: hypothetical protein PK031_07430 [Pseudomonadales bacterium]|nr:hypothetical protein [Pseudomonadales bacterium]
MKSTFYRSILCTLMVSMLLIGCAAPDNSPPARVVDGTTEDSTVTSLDSIMNSLPSMEHCTLRVAVARIRLGDGALNTYGNLGKKINGMTAQQVIDFSQQYPALSLAQAQCMP